MVTKDRECAGQHEELSQYTNLSVSFFSNQQLDYLRCQRDTDTETLLSGLEFGSNTVHTELT